MGLHFMGVKLILNYLMPEATNFIVQIFDLFEGHGGHHHGGGTQNALASAAAASAISFYSDR